MNRATDVTVEESRQAWPKRAPQGELYAALDRLLARRGCAPIADVAARPMLYASSASIEEVDARLDDGRVVRLVCKDAGNPAILPAARGVKPRFLRNPRREIAVYESVLGPAPVGAPTCYGHMIDRRRGRYWLFLERIAGPPLAEVGDFDVWRHVSRWLARMHTDARLRARVSASIDSVPLVRYDSVFYRRWMSRARDFQLTTSQASSSERMRFQWLASRYSAIVDEIDRLPVGFVHGEFYASNILIEGAVAAARVRPLDWELAGIGSPLIDLAALTAGWKDEPRRELALSYHRELDSRDPSWLPFEAFTRALDCFRVQLAVRCLGWARRWTPPRSHARDWLGEALQAAERIA
jgi:hypothetical protein